MLYPENYPLSVLTTIFQVDLVSRYQNDSIPDFFWEINVIETVVTTGATRRAQLQSKCYTNKPTSSFYRLDALPVA